jgi:tripeptide aminopeptidase
LLQESIVQEFLELVQIDVQSLNERQIADRLKLKLAALGCEVSEDNAGERLGGNTGNLIARLKGNENYPPLLLSAHMDRVSQGCNIQPVLAEGKLASNGSTILAADDVAGLVSILDGVRRVQQEKIDHCPLEIVFSVCEEQGVAGSKQLDFASLRAKIAYVFDSSGPLGRIVQSAPAKCNILLKIHGKFAHAGNEPDKGLNAIKIAGLFMAQVKEGRLSDCSTANFGKIHGGAATNVVCDYVELAGEARSRNQAELDHYLDYLSELVSTIAKQSQTRIDLEIEKHYDAFFVEETEPVSLLLKKAFQAMETPCYFSEGGGGMDANRFCSAGIRSLGVATGYSKNHTLDEEIVLADLIQSGELVKQIILQASQPQERAQ